MKSHTHSDSFDFPTKAFMDKLQISFHISPKCKCVRNHSKKLPIKNCYYRLK